MTLEPQPKVEPWITSKDIEEMSKYIKPEVIEAYRSRPTVVIDWKGSDDKLYKVEVPKLGYHTNPFE
jgi:hypothetical protein